MNTGIIIKLEYKVTGETDFRELEYTGFSANFVSNQEQTDAGAKFSLKIQARIPKIETAKSELLFYLMGRPMQVRFTDSNGTEHLAGDNSYPARLGFNQSIGGNPGDWNGYDIIILQEAPFPHSVSIPEVL